ncbi:MAG: methyl-accepting chemotaxis protein [Hyphomicrobiaceae bacterium]
MPASFKFIRNLSITRVVITLAVTLFISLIAKTGIAEYKSRELEIQGVFYNQIIDGKDLVADLLPPPLYLVEAYLETHVLADNPSELVRSRQRLTKMKSDYDEQIKKWARSTLPTSIKSDLVEVSNIETQKFWDEINKTFLPAIERGDRAVAGQSLTQVGDIFVKHREIVIKLISRASEHLKQIETATAVSDRWWRMAELIVTAVVFALSALIVWAMRSLVSSPLRSISLRTRSLASGDLAPPIPFEGQQNEVGQIADALVVFRNAAVDRQKLETDAVMQRRQVEEERRIIADQQAQAVRVVGEALGSLSEGDLTRRIETEIAAEYQTLKDDFNNTVERLLATMSAVTSGTDAIKSGTREIAQASDDLARRTENQAASLEETAAAVEEITATVKKTAEGANHARQVVSTAKLEAEKSGDVVRKAIEAMSGIEKSSKEISQIIGVIDEIAFQTNLLALNAGVEAARAGDAGRGFAVVASEVRALAQRSADAAKQIKGLISTSTAQVDQGVQLVAQTGTALERIVVGVAEINTVVSEIAASAQEQATGLQQVNVAVNQMDQVTQQNAAMVEEATAATRTLAEQSDELVRLVGRFQTGAAHAADPIRNELKKVVPHVFASASAGRTEPAASRDPRKVAKLAPRSMGKAVAAGGPGSVRHAAAAGTSNEGWEEF